MAGRRLARVVLTVHLLAAPLAAGADAVPYDAFASLCADAFWHRFADVPGCGPRSIESDLSVTTGLPVEEDGPQDSIASLLANALAGNPRARTFLETHFTEGAVVPLVPLRPDPCDALEGSGAQACTMPGFGANPAWSAAGAPTASALLSDYQEALLGCGPYYQTRCEFEGLDVENAEISVLSQSWPGTIGEYGAWIQWRHADGCPATPRGSYGNPCFPTYPDLRTYCIGCIDPDGAPFPVPGTLGFDGPLPALRFTTEGVVQLEGARGPSSPAWVLEQDGSTEGLAIPAWDDPPRGVANGFGTATGLAFRSELAALSWNLAMTLVALSHATDPEAPANDEFDPHDPARVGVGLCSFRQPQFCRALAYPVPEASSALAGVAALFAICLCARCLARD